MRKSLELKAVVDGSMGAGSKVARRSSVMVVKVSMGRPRVVDQSLKRPSHSAPRRCGIPSQDRRWERGLVSGRIGLEQRRHQCGIIVGGGSYEVAALLVDGSGIAEGSGWWCFLETSGREAWVVESEVVVEGV